MRNLDDEASSRSLAGSLLVAHPSMLDPNFRRTVLFISEHDPNEGALGMIINRPLDRQVADLVTDTPPPGLAGVPVFLGGPVGKNQLMFAAFEWKKGHGFKLSHNVVLGHGSTAAGEKTSRKPGCFKKQILHCLSLIACQTSGSTSWPAWGHGIKCSPQRRTIRP